MQTYKFHHLNKERLVQASSWEEAIRAAERIAKDTLAEVVVEDMAAYGRWTVVHHPPVNDQQ